MTLPASGQLSLSAVQTEFGGTNPISISEYYSGGALVPSGATGLNGAVPSSGLVSLSQYYATSISASQLPGNYFLMRNGTSTHTWVELTVGLDGSIYRAGKTSTPDCLFSKMDMFGTMVFSKSIDLGTLSTISSSVTTDPSGNVILTCEYDAAAEGSSDNTAPPVTSYIIKTDSAGTVLWTRKLSISTTYHVGAIISECDANGDIYVVGHTIILALTSTTHRFFIAKLASDGTFLWANSWSTQGQSDAAEPLCIDSAGNACAGTMQFVSSQQRPTVLSFDPTGALVFARTFYSATVLGRVLSIFPTGSDLVFTYYDNGGATRHGIICIDSTGTNILWQKRFNETSYTSPDGNRCAVNPVDGSIFWAVHLNVTSVYSIILMNLDTSGNLIWCNKISYSYTGGIILKSMKTDIDGTIYLNTNSMTLVLNKDGSTQGTWVLTSSLVNGTLTIAPYVPNIINTDAVAYAASGAVAASSITSASVTLSSVAAATVAARTTLMPGVR